MESDAVEHGGHKADLHVDLRIRQVGDVSGIDGVLQVSGQCREVLRVPSLDETVGGVEGLVASAAIVVNSSSRPRLV